MNPCFFTPVTKGPVKKPLAAHRPPCSLNPVNAGYLDPSNVIHNRLSGLSGYSPSPVARRPIHSRNISIDGVIFFERSQVSQ
ncbi:hypothetical protein ACVWWU_000530 [Pantoea sp. PA1]|nr:hypothetical protein C7420_106184 [Pantoea ananatis]